MTSPIIRVCALGMALSLTLPALAQRPQRGHQTDQSKRTDKYELRGKVTDHNGEPIPGVVVSFKGTDTKAITDQAGLFRLPTNHSGRYTLIFTAIGYDPMERTAVLDGQPQGFTAHLNMVLRERTTDLQQVEILGRKERSYKNTVSFVGTKTATALKDVPQSVGYVTKELVLDQGAMTVNDVVKNISGVNQYTFYNDFSIRGFRTTGNRSSGNLINGMRAQTSLWKQSTLANIERVEIIKGPASALFGNASPGGVINRVTKKPLDYARNTFTAGVGSFNTLKAYGDFTGPLNYERSLLYRLNLGYEKTDSFRDLQGNKTYVVAPSFSYVPSERTQFNIDLFYQKNDGKLDRGQTIFGDQDLLSRPITSTLAAANDFLREELINTTLSLSHHLSDNLTLNSSYLFSSYNEDLQEHTQANAYVSDKEGNTNPDRVLMNAVQRKKVFRNNSFNNYLTYTLNLGQVKQRFLAGYDYFQMEQAPGSSESKASGYLLKNGKTTTKFDKAKLSNYLLDTDGNPKTNVPYFDLNTNTGNGYLDISKYIYETTVQQPYLYYSHGVYLQDQLQWKKLQLLLSLRWEQYNEVINRHTKTETKTTQTALLPRVGLVYSLTKNINLYGTWLKGFEPQTSTVQSNPKTGGPFDPEFSELFEVGSKSDWFDQRLSLTFALFHLTKRNTLYNAGDATNTDLMIPIGEEVSKGFELDLAGRILPHWSIVASYAYNQAEITKATEETRDLNLQRPNTPKHSANIWTKYIIPRGAWRNLGIGIGYNYVSAREGQVGKRTNTVSYPAYGLLNLALYYKVSDVQLQLNLNNVFDKTHWVGGYDRLRSFPGMPRNLNASVTYQF